MKKNIKKTLIFMQVALMLGFAFSTATAVADPATIWSPVPLSMPMAR